MSGRGRLIGTYVKGSQGYGFNPPGSIRNHGDIRCEPAINYQNTANLIRLLH